MVIVSRGRTIAWLIATIAMGGAFAFGQNDTPQLSRDLEELSSEADLVLTGQVIDWNREVALRREAVKLLGSTSQVRDIDYGRLAKLSQFAQPLSSEEIAGFESLRSSLQASSPAAAVSTFEAFSGRMGLMSRIGYGSGLRAAETLEWVKSNGGVSALSPQQLIVVYDSLSAPVIGSRGLKVEWSGVLAAPSDGEYRFSSMPRNMNMQHGVVSVKYAFSVSLDGKAVLQTDGKQWRPLGEPVQMAAGQRTPITVALEFDSTYSEYTYDKVPVVQLFWQSANVSRQIVPAGAFPDGLTATYESIDEQGLLHELVRLDPQIDFAWLTASSLPGAFEAERTDVLRALFDQTVKPEYLDAAAESGASIESPLLAMHEWVGSLDSRRRADVLTAVLERPSLLDALNTPADARRLFCAFHVCDPDDALRLLGIWSRRHADWESVFSRNLDQFTIRNRYRFRDYTIHIVQEDPSSLDKLKERYLVDESGRCVLPVAYILTFGHLCQGQMERWIGELDARLKPSSLEGDARVNWLLARAYAEELRASSADFHVHGPDFPMLGLPWYFEAAKTAETEPCRLRALREVAVRYYLYDQNPNFEALLSQLPAGIPNQWTSEMAEQNMRRTRDRDRFASESAETLRKELQSLYSDGKRGPIPQRIADLIEGKK